MKETSAGQGLLAEIAAGLSSGSDLHELLGRFLRTIVEMADAQAGAVRLLDPASGRLHLAGDLGLPGGVRAAELAVEHDCGACGAAVRAGGPVWADDLSACARRHAGAYFGHGCTRLLAVPLHHRGRVLGVYNLFFDAAHQPGEPVMALLRSIGELLGLALDNARLERENLQATLLHERQMMAAEVHDSLAQSLAFVKMRLPLLHDAMLAHDDARSLRYVEDIRATVSEAHTGLRQILTDFHTRPDPQGFMHAVRALVAGFEPRTGIAFELDDRVGELFLPPQAQSQAFHVVQEALANIARHSMARHASLRIALQGGEVEVLIEDDGTGVAREPREAATTHYGIDIMKARARRLGGSLALSARAGGGTCVALRFPLRPDGGATAAPAAAWGS
jgi:two-component system, NarL family, nitrate/nitrite sensor histidine kinase NarX